MTVSVSGADAVLGTIEIPSDKSIAHRAAILAAITDGTSRLVHYPDSADPQSTLACLRALGVRIEDEDGILAVHGRGRRVFEEPSGPLDCGNSGTTMRLLAGVLAGQPFESVLAGDASLSGRPMERIAVPLRLMGAEVDLTDGHAPVTIRGGRLRAIEYPLPIQSAQIKSCVLLAGLYADGETTVVESVVSRDHTERMLGLPVVDFGSQRSVSVSSSHRLIPQTWTIPRDVSAAAFFIVGATVVPRSILELPGVGVNPGRAALIDVLNSMGGSVEVSNTRLRSGEPIADIRIESARLTGVDIGGDLIPRLVDEIPVLAVAATQSDGVTTIRDAAELRVKESDRIAAIATALRTMGASIEELPDGLRIAGPTPLHGGRVDACGDHRIAMALGIAGIAAEGTTTISGSEAASVSYPAFWADLAKVAIGAEVMVGT